MIEFALGASIAAVLVTIGAHFVYRSALRRARSFDEMKAEAARRNTPQPFMYRAAE